MSTPPSKQTTQTPLTTSDTAPPSQPSMTTMSVMSQGSQDNVDDGSSSGLSRDSSVYKQDSTVVLEKTVLDPVMVSHGVSTKKQITMTQYTRSSKEKLKRVVDGGKAKELLEFEDDDDVCFVKTEVEVKHQCIHCHSNPCHDTIFGEFCSEDTKNYIRTGWYNESRVYTYFAASYKGAKKYRQWTKTGEVSFDSNPSIPSCLFNASYSCIVKELRDDAIRAKWGKKRRLVGGNVYEDMSD